MSTKAKSGFKCIKKINSVNTLKFKKSGLKSGKKYYFKVRAFVKNKGVVSYTNFSKVKNVKVK